MLNVAHTKIQDVEKLQYKNTEVANKRDLMEKLHGWSNKRDLANINGGKVAWMVEI